MELVRIPAGRFVMGSDAGCLDERPATAVEIDKPFWIGQFEVTNAQFARFDPTHDSRVESKHAMQFGVRGFYVNGPRQPVVRISWQQAMAFCRWLGERTGRACTLPTEAQWEYACRAGADSPFYYGDTDADFSRFANLADLTLREFVCDPYRKDRVPFANPGKYDDWIPKDERFNDHGFVSEEVGRYEPNAWGLCDVHGNVSEWTRSAMRAYPYVAGDGRNDPAGPSDRVVRGGSWRDRPPRAHAAFRLAYRDYQRVYNVGFRVALEGD
jgi:formylglycine-generating enzyme required for sulfatase activity